MECPKCKSLNDKVINTRPRIKSGEHVIKRRRECIDCNWRWSTIESKCIKED